MSIVPIASTTLKLQPGMTFEEWLNLGRELGKGSNVLSWAIGDWYFYGEWEYGAKYEQGAAATGLTPQTLADLKYVAGRFEISRRREKLSLSHHREVAPLPLAEQDEWLDRAQTNGWNREQLRAALAELRQAKPGASPRALTAPTGAPEAVPDPDTPGAPDAGERPLIVCPECGHAFDPMEVT